MTQVKPFIIKTPNEPPEGVSRTIVYEGKKIPAKIFFQRTSLGKEKYAAIYPPHSFFAAIRIIRLT